MQPISVVIVSWNAKDHLLRCLDSLKAHARDVVLETIVVDNDSADGSPEAVERAHPDVTVIRAGRNLGFGRANNLAFARARGRYVAMINSDVTLHPDCLQRLAAYLDGHPEASLVAPRILGRDGRLQRTCKRLPGIWNTFCRFVALDRVMPDSPLFSGFELPADQHHETQAVPAIGGCFWLLRRAAIEQVGAFDERFFFYAEDIDWCKRFGEAGWQVVYHPAASATHYGGGSTERAPVRYSIQIIRATLQYWRKHHGGLGWLLCFAMYVGHHGLRLVPRLALWLLSAGRARNTTSKIVEDFSCLRWLLTGSEPALKANK